MAMSIREVRRECERFSRRMIASGANPVELAGLMIGALARELRDLGHSRDRFVAACAMLWDNNNPADEPIDQEPPAKKGEPS